MTKEIWTFSEVIDLLHMDADLLSALEAEEIVCAVCRQDPPDKFFSIQDVEKLRLVKVLMEEMDVNLAGVEVILRMRENMIAMREQFDAILEDLARHLEERFKDAP